MTDKNWNFSEERERQYEDAMAHRYNRDYHEPPIMQSHSRAFVDYVRKHTRPGDRVLDLGCASASLWPLFHKQLDSSVTLVGVDLSAKMLDEARQQFPKGTFRVGSMLDIPCGNGEFDVVIVSSAFHHINDDRLPHALSEISRVLDEHGLLIGREPLATGRVGDRGGWLAGALMHLRHLVYRLTHSREFPEPDPGPDHHAYDARQFFSTIGEHLSVVDVAFRNPVSVFLARSHHPAVVAVAAMLDEIIEHKEGQEVLYAARKNYSESADVSECVKRALDENQIADIPKFLAYVKEAAVVLERILEAEMKEHSHSCERRFVKKRS